MTAPRVVNSIGRGGSSRPICGIATILIWSAPAMPLIRADGRGEIAFGAVQAGRDLEYSRFMVFFTWAGFDEMDQVSGSGSAELLHDGSLAIAFAYHLGDEAVLKAKRATSSAPC